MARETLRDKVARLEAELAAMTEQRRSYRDEANNLKKQVNARVEDTDLYKSTVKQWQETDDKLKRAVVQRDRYKAKVQSLEDERESWQEQYIQAEEIEQLQNQLDASQKAQDALQAALDAVQEELQQIKATQVHNARGAGRKPKLADDQVQEIQQLRSEGRTMAEISKQVGCSVGLVYNTIQKLNNECNK